MKTLMSSSPRSLVYHDKNAEGKDEIWKIYPDNDKDTLEKEYAISARFTSPCLRKALRISEYHNQTALVLEYVNGINLEEFINRQPLALTDFFPLAFKMLDILYDLQKEGILHNRINTRNILVVPESNHLWMIDFAHAETSPFNPILHPVSTFTEELAYFSPELTGQIKRKTDYRSDLYAAGIILYELLTGQCPFRSKSISELLYAIIAQTVLPVRWLNPIVPKFLEDILTKILSKSPEERYQSIDGLRADLEICLNNFNHPEQQIVHIPGQYDSMIDLRFSEKLYGRESIFNMFLKELYGVIKGEKSFISLLGQPGAGKSALGKKFREEVLRQRAIFISGKFDFHNQGKPFYALEQTLKEFASYVLSEDEYRLINWKQSIRLAVGEIGKVLTDLIPEFRWILGDQPEVPSLNGAEAQSRLQYLFQRLIEFLADHDHPLVLFLDDFQWADQSSINLIDSLVHYPRLHHFMLITASRVEELEGQGDTLIRSDNIKHITLRNLDSKAVTELLDDSIKTIDNRLLSTLIYDKTQGNPFFTHQFIHALWRNKIFQFDTREQVWNFNVKEIASFHATENVIEFILLTLKDLSPECLKLLQYASCLGNTFLIHNLSTLLQLSDDHCVHLLQEAFQKGLVSREDSGLYQFIHDRIQESFYKQLTDPQRKYMHYTIGNNMLTIYGRSPQAETLFEITRQLNLGGDHLPISERFNLILLNYKCGQKAKEKAAFAPALEYFKKGIEALHPDDWHSQYELLLSLYANGAESAAIAGERSCSESWANEVISQGRNIHDKLKGYEVKLNILNENNEMLQAVDLLLRLLKQLGFPITRNPPKLVILAELIRTKRMLWSKKGQSILDLPKMTDENASAFMKLSARCTTSIFSAAPEILPLIIFKQVQLSVKYGNSLYSPVGYAAYGFALSSIMGEHERGFYFGEMATRLAKINDSAEVQAKVMTMFYGFLAYWKKDIRDSIPALRQAYTIGRETGDLLYASFATTFHSSLLFFTGEKLQKVEKIMQEDSIVINKMNQDLVYIVSENQRQLVHNLTTASDAGPFITGNEASEQDFVQKLLVKKDAATLFDFYVYKLILAYLLNDPVIAFWYAEKAFYYEDDTSSHQITYPHFLFFTCLAAADAYRVRPEKKYKRRLNRAISGLKKIIRHSRPNFEAKYYMAIGAAHSITGKQDIALKYYSLGIESARTSNFIHLEAIGYELVGKDYARCERWALADLFLRKSYTAYTAWGASAKCNMLSKQYPNYFRKVFPIMKPMCKIWYCQILQSSNSVTGYLPLQVLTSYLKI